MNPEIASHQQLNIEIAKKPRFESSGVVDKGKKEDAGSHLAGLMNTNVKLSRLTFTLASSVYCKNPYNNLEAHKLVLLSSYKSLCKSP
nr:hypothetical protein [Tanacetum cinerariifolium]